MTNFRKLSVDLDVALKKLRQRWNESKARWPHEEFEKEYLMPLEKQASITWKAMDELTKTINKAEQQIGPRWQR